jgi:hypothetical protein
MGRRTALAVAGWLAAAVAATLTGLGAVRIIGEGITGTAAATLSQEQVADALAAPAPATRTPIPRPTASGPTKTFVTDGGTVVARCENGLVTLVSWAPALGFQVTDADPGPDDDAEVKFRSNNQEQETQVTCKEGSPTLTPDDD